MRFGHLEYAENRFKQSIMLTEQSHDPVNQSAFSTYLSLTLQQQGNHKDAKKYLLQALKLARQTHIKPYIGRALVTMGCIRMEQAIANSKTKGLTDLESRKALNYTKRTLERALAIESMEAETRIEGQIALAYTTLLLGNPNNALQLATQTLEDARKFELTWLVARVQSFLGSISDFLHQYEQADKYFEIAVRIFRKNEMKLEYARTLQYYGEALAQRDTDNHASRQQGLAYLREAHEIFKECKATLDLQVAERMLTLYEKVTKS
jgi:tetratricopeptide (TPR) repeat protein